MTKVGEAEIFAVGSATDTGALAVGGSGANFLLQPAKETKGNGQYNRDQNPIKSIQWITPSEES